MNLSEDWIQSFKSKGNFELGLFSFHPLQSQEGMYFPRAIFCHTGRKTGTQFHNLPGGMTAITYLKQSEN